MSPRRYRPRTGPDSSKAHYHDFSEEERLRARVRALEEALTTVEDFLHTLRLATTKDEVWALVSSDGNWTKSVHDAVIAALTHPPAEEGVRDE